MEKGQILQVRSDRLFHDLFNQEMMMTLEWTVMQILGCSYEKVKDRVKVGNIRLRNVNPKERGKYVDLILELENEKIIIELNNNYNESSVRNILYAFSVILNQYAIDKPKDNVENIKFILVNLNWHSSQKMAKEIPDKRVEIISRPDRFHSEYFLKIIDINLDNYDKKCYTEVEETDKLWKLLTIKKVEELEKYVEDEELLQNYSKKLCYLSLDEEYCDMIMDENIEKNVAREDAYNAGINVGFEKGINQMILNMAKNKIPKEMICKVTSLSLEEVEEIISENDIEE